LTASTSRRGGAARLDRLIVTRPAQDMAAWVDALQAAGWPALALPLIEIGEPQDADTLTALKDWRRHWWQMDAIMFVSAAAVRHFFAGEVVVSPPGREVQTRFWAPGPGTAQALIKPLADRGVDAGQIDSPPADAAQFDSEALWPVVSAQMSPGCRVLIVRGQSDTVEPNEPDRPGQVVGKGRDWLIQQCAAAGARVEGCVAYVRRTPVFSEAEKRLALAASGSGSAWLFSSSEALDHVSAIAPASGWAQASALATHPRIAATARGAGFGRIVACRPALADVLRALESQWSRP
jgi:uroporphyrinogen-III synthase